MYLLAYMLCGDTVTYPAYVGISLCGEAGWGSIQARWVLHTVGDYSVNNK